MRVLKVWDSEYPWDVRAEKVCQALGAAGHEVHMVARNRDQRPLRETLPECTVHRLRPFTWAGQRVDAASQFPAFFNPRWTRLMKRVGREVGAAVILVRDLPLAPAAVRVGRRLRIPVVLDMAENYPAMIRDLWTTGATRLGDSLVRNPRAVEAIERWVLRNVDHVLVVVEESRDRLVALGFPADRISVVGNTPSLDRLEEFSALRNRRADQVAHGNGAGAMRVVYLGLMEEARGVRIVIEAVADARAGGTPVSLELIGEGRALDAFRTRARELGSADDIVRFRGFLPYRDALREVARADVGIIPHYANESWETTIPNKLFDYMSLGLPVIASDVTPVARVLAETGAGVTFRDRDRTDLARVLGTLSADPARAEMGNAGIRWIRERYHWENDAARLVSALEGVVSRRGRSETGGRVSSSR